MMETKVKEKKQTKKGKKLLKVLAVILAVIIVLAAGSAAVTAISLKANTEKANTFETVVYENQLIPEKDENGYWTFTTDEEFKVMQLTDIHIGGGWMSKKTDAMALNAVASMITAEKPDLVVITGDTAYPVPFQAGTFNNLSSAKLFATLMEKLGVYWVICFGNHDTEAYSYYSREDISEFYASEELKYCLFEAGPEDVDGCGNQIINIKNSDGLITQSLYMFDSHSYINGDVLGLRWQYDNIHQSQIDWYKSTLETLNAQNQKILDEQGKNEKADIKSSAFFHIPLDEQREAWYEYANNGFEDTENVKLVYGVAGEGKKIVYSGVGEDELFETMLELGSTKAIFCGHDHYNNFSIDYKGIRLTYGMSVDYLAYPGIYKLGSQRGCTIINYAPDGSFECNQESYYQDKYTALYDKESVEMQEMNQVAPPSETE